MIGTESVRRVADSRQAALLLDVALRPVIARLMKWPSSAAELGRAEGLKLRRAHYLIGRLLEAGVAELDSVQPRAGRAIRRYRVAPRWFVPYEVTGAETLDAFLAAQIMPRMGQIVGLGTRQLEAALDDFGFWLEREGEGSTLRMGDSGGAATALFAGDEPFLLNIGTLHLSDEGASRLKRRLEAVVEEFQTLHDLKNSPYTVGLQLVRGVVG